MPPRGGARTALCGRQGQFHGARMHSVPDAENGRVHANGWMASKFHFDRGKVGCPSAKEGVSIGRAMFASPWIDSRTRDARAQRLEPCGLKGHRTTSCPLVQRKPGATARSNRSTQPARVPQCRGEELVAPTGRERISVASSSANDRQAGSASAALLKCSHSSRSSSSASR